MKLRIHWLSDVPFDLAIMPRPRGGEDLRDELQMFRSLGADVLVNLLTASEMAELELTAEPRLCRELDIKYLSLPIEDVAVPQHLPAAETLVSSIVTELRIGKKVVIHCRAGIGRSSLIAACVLNVLGFEPIPAFRILSEARGVRVPDTQQQRDWVIDYCKRGKHR